MRSSVTAVAAMLACSPWLAGCASTRSAQVPAVPSSPAASDAPSTPASTPAAASNASGAASPPDAPGTAEGTEGRAGAKTPDEQRDTLDGNLQASLSEFDALLLKEQQEVAAERAERGAGATGGAGGGGEGEGGEGSGGGSSGTGARQGEESASQDKSGGRTKDQSTGSSTDMRQGGGREAATAPEGTPPAGSADTRVPPDVGDGRDDDVVARQLREAAMSEENPAIREKLWEEYRRYKSGDR